MGCGACVRGVLTMDPHQTYRFTWQDIEIEATYAPLKWGVIGHLEVRSVAPEGAPLPITKTGYRSHFHPPGTVETNGGDIVAQVIAWLDEEAAQSKWQRYMEDGRQGELF